MNSTLPRARPAAIPGIDEAVAAMASRARDWVPGRAMLVAISGIDASGKGTVAAELVRGLERGGLRPALIPLDPWHEPAAIRFSTVEPAARFYHRAFRWDALFGDLIDPLVQRRSIRLTARQLRLRDDAWYEHRFAFDDVDIVVLEGIFLFKREPRARYDASLWVECSFERALVRALRRNQEGLPRERLRSDYERVYFPAQRLHLRRDDPRAFAETVLVNE